MKLLSETRLSTHVKAERGQVDCISDSGIGYFRVEVGSAPAREKVGHHNNLNIDSRPLNLESNIFWRAYVVSCSSFQPPNASTERLR